LLTILSLDISGLHLIFWLLVFFYSYWLKFSFSAECLTIIGYYFNFFEELFWIFLRLWGLMLFLAEGLLRGVWLIVFFPVRLRPLLLIDEVFGYLDGSFVGVLNCRLAVSGTSYRLIISFLVCKGFYCLAAFLTIWDLLVASCDLIFLEGLFSCCGSIWCCCIFVDFKETLAVQFSFPYWKQMLFFMRNSINSALWPSERFANSTVLVVYFLRMYNNINGWILIIIEMLFSCAKRLLRFRDQE
jgi:hypothetical protein